MSEQLCVLCNELGGRLLWQNDLVRVINADDALYPAFTRVIYQKHVKEMSDLNPAQRHQLMDFVYLVEEVQREILEPVKINLAQFGTMVPHLHWHIIPRFKEDPHYPDAVWSTAKPELNHETINDYLNKQKKLLHRYELVLTDRLKSIYK